MSHFHHFYTQDQFAAAVRRNDFEQIERLLAHHTDVIVCRKAAEEAAETNAVDCLQLLLPHCGDYTFDAAITTAAARFQPSVVQTLVSYYPPDTVDTMRLESAYEKKICEESVRILLPYFTTSQRFTFFINVSAPMSEVFVRELIVGLDPLFNDSAMLAWGALHNDARVDVMYPISDPTQALLKLERFKTRNSSDMKNKIDTAIERIEALMQRAVLHAQVDSPHTSTKSKM